MINRIFNGLLLVVLINCVWPIVSAQTLRPLPVEAALAQTSFPAQTPALNFSPDGQLIAYTLQDDRNPEIDRNRKFLTPPDGASFLMRGCSIWLVDLKSNEAKNISGNEGSSWGPVWSPDGKYLAFYSDRTGAEHLWVWEASSATLRQVSDATVHTLYGFEVAHWTPDSKKILTKILPQRRAIADLSKTPETIEPQKTGNGSTVVIYTHLPSLGQKDFARRDADLFESSNGDLALIDLVSSTVKYIAPGFDKPRWFSISPDGSHVAFTNVKGLETGNSQQVLYDLVTVSLSDGSARVLASNIRQVFGINASWSPDGKVLSYMTSGPLAKGDCYLVDINGGEPRNLTMDPHPNFGHPFRAPFWDGSGTSIYLATSQAVWRVPTTGRATELTSLQNRRLIEIVPGSEHGRLGTSFDRRFTYLFTIDDETKQTGFVELNLTTGKTRNLIEFKRACGDYPTFKLGVSSGGKWIAYVVQDSQHSEDIWLASTDFRDVRQVTHSNSQLEAYQLGASRLIEWRSVDGEKLKGALLLPAGYQEGKRYPLIVRVYGAAFRSNLVNQFGLEGGGVENKQLFATRGYVVLLPDAPTRLGTPMQDLLKTVMPGVDKVVEMGIADPEKLAVWGHSYGGYSALALIVQTTRFKAAVASGGPYDLISDYGTLNPAHTGWAEEGQGKMGGSPWEFRDRYIENSPVFYLDRVQTPLLLIHGTLDVIPPTIAEEVFAGLRRLDKDVVYAKYEGEGHWQGTFSYANQVDYLNRVIDWFDKYLKASESAPRMSQ